MTMTKLSRRPGSRRATLNRWALVAALLLVPGLGRLTATSAEPDGTVERWALQVWEAARGGDTGTLEHAIDRMPASHVSIESADRFRTSVDRIRRNRTDSAAMRVTQRDEALGEMRAEIEADHLAKALRKAVEAQTYSDDLNSAFDNQDIMQLVRWAQERIPVMEDQHMWLDAQELLYLLRTFYEDTDRRAEFEQYDERLEYVNQRVGLIARFVPRRLHDMRNERAERIGEETFGEFNPATAVDWRERLDGVDHRMLTQSLRTAAVEHIETGGWRPLIEGGLQSLRLLATTEALSETFPTLADPARVGQWTNYIEEKLRELNHSGDGDLNHWTLKDLLDGLNRVNQATLDVPLPVILREFGDGALTKLDTYSEIIWPDKLRRFQQATAGNFVGVGILIRHNDKREVMVVNPLEGTPAYFAGVKPEDLIAEVNGDPTVGWSLNDAVDRITGPKGTVVMLGVRREGENDLVKIAITRDIIKIRSVKGWYKEDLNENGDPVWNWFIDPYSRIAYIRLTQFTEDSYGDLRQAWREVNADGRPSGLILDLRHNPGGLLTSAVQISNLFVPNGSIVTGEDKDGNRAWGQDARPNFAEFAGTPTVVLINQGSASASEIVAGCLQAHGAAVIVGERSFGKGSVQTIHHVAREGRLKLTTQYYRLPSPDGVTKGRLVHKRPGADVWGVDPDVEVQMSVQQVSDTIRLRSAAEIIPLGDDGVLNPDDEERPDVNDLLTEGTDPQLATGLLLLQARALATDDVRHARR